MNKYLYKIKDLEVPPWLKYWFARKSKINFDLSEILNGTSFDLTDTVNKKLHLIDIFGNSEQEKLSGKNLLNAQTKLINTVTEKGIVFVNNGDGTFNISGTATENYNKNIIQDISDIIQKNKKYYFYCSANYDIQKFNLAIRVSFFNGTAQFIQANELKELNNIEILSAVVVLWVGEGITVNTNTNVKLMVVESDVVDNDYETYCGGQASPNPDYPQEIKSSGDNGSIVEKFSNSDNTQLQTYTIPCQQPMRAIGNVKDTFVKIEGVWYERHYINRLILRGNQNWCASSSQVVNRYFMNLSDGKILDDYRQQVSYCNYYHYDYNSGEVGGFYLGSYQGTTRVFINYGEKDTSTIQDFKDFLEEKFTQEKPVYIDYVLKEPIDLPCTTEQITALEEIQNARTYKNITHIYSEDEVPADLEIQYYKEKGE